MGRPEPEDPQAKVWVVAQHRKRVDPRKGQNKVSTLSGKSQWEQSGREIERVELRGTERKKKKRKNKQSGRKKRRFQVSQNYKTSISRCWGKRPMF